MSPASLDGPLLKLARAREHLEYLQALVGTFIQEETKRVTVEDDPESGYRLLVLNEPRDPPITWNPIIGDVLYNLRSALDHLAFQLVYANNKNPNATGTGFPIFDKIETYVEKGLPQVRGMSQDVQTAIEATQPYHRPSPPWQTDSLLLLNRLNNVYKHRHFKLTVLDVQMVAGFGIPKDFQFGDTRPKEGRAVLGAWKPSHEKVDMDGTVHLDVVFADSPWGDDQVVGTLSRLLQTTAETVLSIASVGGIPLPLA